MTKQKGNVMAHQVADYEWAHDHLDPHEPCEMPTPIVRPRQWSMLGWTMYRCQNCESLIRFMGPKQKGK